DQRGISGDTDQRAFKLTNRSFKARGDEFQDRSINGGAIGRRLLHQNGNTSFQIWRLNICNQSAFKAGSQPVFQSGQLLRRAVRGQNNLLISLVQSIEGMEELFLG